MNQKLLLLLGLLLGATYSSAQVTVQSNTQAKKMDLEECIGIALRNNPQLKQSDLQVQADGNNLEQSRWQRWPSLAFNASQGLSFGRNIDPFTNQFVQQTVNFNNFQLGGGMTLFAGYQLQNTIKQNSLNLQASQKDLDVARNNLMLNIAAAYLQVLNNQELIEVSRQQLEATRLQLGRTQQLVAAGTLPEANLYDLRAQEANDELNLVNAQNNVQLALVNLKQLMNLPAGEAIEVAAIQAQDPSLRQYDASVDEVFTAALGTLPELKGAELRIAAAQKGVEVAKAAGMPTLSLNGGVNTAFSSAAPKQRFVADGTGSQTLDVPSATKFIQVQDFRIPLIETLTIPNGSFQDFRYFNQLNFNRNASLNLSLRVPIFTQYQAKYRMANARIQQKNVEYQLDVVKQQIRQNVEQAYVNMDNAAKRYAATLNQVRALEEAFRVAESRFAVGGINSIEYNISKANLDRSKASLIQAKYDYIFRTKILDFYRSKPLID